MSKHDLLTVEESAAARKQGWMLYEVYDLNTGRLGRQVMPPGFSKALRNVDVTTRFVISKAKQGDKVALKALQLINQGHTA